MKRKAGVLLLARKTPRTTLDKSFFHSVLLPSVNNKKPPHNP